MLPLNYSHFGDKVIIEDFTSRSKIDLTEMSFWKVTTELDFSLFKRNSIFGVGIFEKCMLRQNLLGTFELHGNKVK